LSAIVRWARMVSVQSWDGLDEALGDPRLVDGFDASLRLLGEGPVLDLAYQLTDSGELDQLLAMEVSQALAALWPRLEALTPK
jgi:hypothetical protein